MASGLSLRVEGSLAPEDSSSDEDEVEVFSSETAPLPQSQESSAESEGELRLVAAMASAVRAVERENSLPAESKTKSEVAVLPVVVEQSAGGDIFGIVYQQRKVIPLVEIETQARREEHPAEDDEFAFDNMEEVEGSAEAVEKAIHQARMKSLQENSQEEQSLDVADESDRNPLELKSGSDEVKPSPAEVCLTPILFPSIVKETIIEVDEDALEDEENAERTDELEKNEQLRAAEMEWEQVMSPSRFTPEVDLYADLNKDETNFEPITYEAALAHLRHCSRRVT